MILDFLNAIGLGEYYNIHAGAKACNSRFIIDMILPNYYLFAKGEGPK